MSIDYSERPQGISESQWKALTSGQREYIAQAQQRAKVEEANLFEAHMMFGRLATDELTWLRDRIMNLEYRLNSQASSDNP